MLHRKECISTATPELYSLPPRKAIRGQVSAFGKRNALRQVNENLLATLIGHYPTKGVCYIRFVPGRQLSVAKYNEAVISLKAATNSLATICEYVAEGTDPLLEMHWKHFLLFAEFGEQEDMDICKDILTFVKCIEKKTLLLEKLPVWKLRKMARYTSIDQYPKDYIMRFDIINEYDRYIPEEDMWGYEEEYRNSYLALTPYKTGNKNFVNSLHQAISTQVDYMVEQGIAKNYLMKFLHPDKTLLNQSNDTQCAAGSKRFDFWNLLALGVTAELSPLINYHIDILNRLYGIHMDYPPVTSNGMTLAEYVPELIIQEDPKKRRTAYKSNPIIDLIGAVGMDATKYMFAYFPNIKCGRKRNTNSDWIEDMSRYDVLKDLYERAKEHGFNLCSTDLSSCTENLNMCDYKGILTYRLLLIRDRLKLKIPDWKIKQRVADCCDILYLTPLTLSKDPEPGTLYFMKKGQMAGERFSFHAMTDELSTIQLQSILNTLALSKNSDALYWSLENGDDGVLPEFAFSEFSRILEMTTGPDVLNREKSYISSEVKFVEFCKTIYFESPAAPITGYRYCSLYKLTREPKDVIYLTDGQHEYERNLFVWFLSNWQHENYEDMLPWEREEYLRFFASYKVLTNQMVGPLFDAVTLWRALQIQYITKHGMIAEKIALCPELINALPKGMDQITPKDTYYLVSNGNYIMCADFKLLDALDKQVEDDFQCGSLIDWILNPNYYRIAKMKLYEATGINWDTARYSTPMVSTPKITIVPVSPKLVEELGICSTNVVVLAGYQGSSQVTQDLVREELEQYAQSQQLSEEYWNRTQVVPIKANLITSTDVISNVDQSNNKTEIPYFHPVIDIDDILEVMYYYEHHDGIAPANYNVKLTEIQSMALTKDIKAMLSQRAILKYNKQLTFYRKPTFKWSFH